MTASPWLKRTLAGRLQRLHLTETVCMWDRFSMVFWVGQINDQSRRNVCIIYVYNIYTLYYCAWWFWEPSSNVQEISSSHPRIFFECQVWSPPSDLRSAWYASCSQFSCGFPLWLGGMQPTTFLFRSHDGRLSLEEFTSGMGEPQTELFSQLLFEKAATTLGP